MRYLFAILFFIPAFVNAQSVTNIFGDYNYKGRLGVGLDTSKPSSTLQIKGNYSAPPFTVGKAGQTMIQTYQPDYSISLGDLTCDDYGIRYDISDFGRQFSWSWCGDTAMVLKGSSGQPKLLGIGNTNPQATLDVTGSIWNSPYMGEPPSIVTNNYGYTFGSANFYGFMGLDTFGSVAFNSTLSAFYITPNSRAFNIDVDTISLPDTYGGASIGWVETDIDGHGHMQRMPPSSGTLQSVTDAGNTTTDNITCYDPRGSGTATTITNGGTLELCTSGFGGAFTGTGIKSRQLTGNSTLVCPILNDGDEKNLVVSINGNFADNNGNIAFIQNGTTGSEPSTPYLGQFFFDTTLTKMKFWNGTTWAIITSTP